MRNPRLIPALITVLITICSCSSFQRSDVFQRDIIFSGQLLYVHDGKELCLVDSGGTSERILYEDKNTIFLPAWSHDGRKIAFFSGIEQKRFRADESTLKIYDLETDRCEDLGKFTEPTFFSKPVWSPDNGHILLMDNESIFSVEVGPREGGDEIPDGQNQSRWAVKCKDIKHGFIDFLTGTMLYTEGQNLYSLDLDSGTREMLTARRNRSVPGDIDIRALAVTNDRTTVAYSDDKKIVLFDLDKRVSREIHKADKYVFWLRFHVSGGKIFYLSGIQDTYTRLRGPALPTGKFDGTACLYSLSLSTRERTRLCPNISNDVRVVNPKLSPDGKYVALVAVKQNRPKVFVVATDGTGYRRITSEKTALYPEWRPDTVGDGRLFDMVCGIVASVFTQ